MNRKECRVTKCFHDWSSNSLDIKEDFQANTKLPCINHLMLAFCHKRLNPTFELNFKAYARCQ